ncbi:MAG: TonB-dependent receptor [Novosphingobium sp.]|nr:TonB-dependent receptor [Novosphingobium sp.]MCP5402830.1 TonB-dependent receptor [Novosphingobium sp.]
MVTRTRQLARAAFISGVAALAICAGGAHAQDMGANGEQADDASGGLGVIVVTAQRRTENLNDVGMSVATASGDELRDQGVADLSDLTAIVPGLTFTETPYGTGVLTMRGIGFYESSMAATSPVATYVDEIPLPYPRLASGATLDLERVEVLKGPQGTLFGQNTTGGLINYIPAGPTDTAEFGINASLGRFLETDVEAFVSGPLGNNLAARLAVRTRQSDDWQRSATRSDQLGETHVTMARLLVDWEPSPSLSFRLNLNGFLDDSDTQAGQAIGLFPGVPTSVQPQELTATLIPPGNSRIADWTPGRDFSRNNDFFQVGLRSTLSVGDNADLIAITSYLEYNQNQFIDADGTAIETADVTQEGYIHSFSQELRLQGETGRLRYVVGGNYSDDKVFDNTVFYVGDSSLALTVPVLPIRTTPTYSTQSSETWAVFGNLDFQITDQLAIQGGIRYTDQIRDFSGCIADSGDGSWAALFSAAYMTVIPPGACTTFNPFTGFIGLHSDSLSEDNVSWRVGLNFQPNSDMLFYANVGRGYKAGSFPTVGGILSIQYTPATQESVLAYEAGAKLTLADGLVQLNGAVFYYDYTDKQFRGKIVDSFFGSIERVYNVPKSNVTGFELELQAAPSEGLTLGATLAYTDSEIESDFAGLTPIGTPINLQGETFEFTPKWAIGANFGYETPLNGALDGFVGVDVNYQSDSHAGYGGLDLFRIDSYALVNTRLGVRSSDDSWHAQLWVRNLFDEYYLTNANYLGEFVYRLTGRPRTYGVSVGARF